MFCYNCGKQLPDYSAQCDRCGVVFQQNPHSGYSRVIINNYSAAPISPCRR